MKFFVLDNDKITAVISSDMNLEQGSAKFIPVSKEALASYSAWMNSHPNQQPTLANIFATNKLTKPSTNTSKVSFSKPTATTAPITKPNVTISSNKKKAMTKQFQQHIKNR
nr:hypothetical protein [Pseudomonas sp. LPH1]